MFKTMDDLLTFGWFAVLLLFATAFLSPLAVETGSGEHVVFITAVQRNSYPWDKNYVVWVKTDLSSSQEESYCIQRGEEVIAETLLQAARDKSPITLSYRTIWAGLFWGLFNDFKCTGDIVVGAE